MGQQDAKEFTEAWESKKSDAEYEIDLPENTTARCINIGLKGKGTFHLNRGVVYGR